MAAQPVDGGLHAVACLASGCVAVGSSSDHSTGVVVTLAAPPPPSQQTPPPLPVIDSTDITSFSWQSSPGQDMGHGTSGSLTPAEATFAVGSAGGVERLPTLAGIGVQVSTPGDWWWVRVVPPQGQQLKAGVTYAATGQPFLTPGSAGAGQGPGLGVAENGFFCSTVGTFTLGNLRIAPDGVIQQFTLSLTQSCAVVASTPPQVVAMIDFNIPRPPGSVPVATPAPAMSGSSHSASPSPSVLTGPAGSPASGAASSAPAGTAGGGTLGVASSPGASPAPTAAATQPSPFSGALADLKRRALGLPATVNHRSGVSSAAVGVLAGLALLVVVIVLGVARTRAKIARR